MRDKWKNKSYYDDSIAEIKEVIDDDLSDFSKDPLDCVSLSRAARMMLELSRVLYAKGESQLSIKSKFQIFLDYLFRGEECFDNKSERYFPNDIDLTSVHFISYTVVYGECLGYKRLT